MFCTTCGKKMKHTKGYYLHPDYDPAQRYNPKTGKEKPPIYARIETWRCPDYEEGYSDRFWSAHDSKSSVYRISKTEWEEHDGHDTYHLYFHPVSFVIGRY